MWVGDECASLCKEYCREHSIPPLDYSRKGRKPSKSGSALVLVLGVPTCTWRQVRRLMNSFGGYA
jgi:hypothetical protein